jgi:hypothetical protein
VQVSSDLLKITNFDFYIAPPVDADYKQMGDDESTPIVLK